MLLNKCAGNIASKVCLQMYITVTCTVTFNFNQEILYSFKFITFTFKRDIYMLWSIETKKLNFDSNGFL